MTAPIVLVVDDEPDNFDVLETLLGDRDYELHYADSSEAALDSLAALHPDLILLDAMMPSLSGIDLCQRLKADPKWRAVPIVMVTALTAKEDLACCLAAGADDFISKPVNRLELQARVQSMLRIKQQYDELQNLLQLREDFVKMTLHDLRHPLTNVLLGLELLSHPHYPEARKAGKIAETLAAAQALQAFADDLLQMARLESGRLALKREATDVAALVLAATDSFAAIAAQKNQTLTCHVPDASLMLLLDRALLRRALDNLLANAIQFSPFEAAIAIAQANPKQLAIQVRDTGPGVPDAFKQRIFEKYEVGTLVTDATQIGLGLAFCKLAIEAHGGEIRVRDNQPSGSVFEITLPVAGEAEEFPAPLLPGLEEGAGG